MLLVRPERLELEALAGVSEREPAAEILSRVLAKDQKCYWCARRDSNLRRLAGVSEAGARSRNPEPGSGEGSETPLVRPERLELPTLCSEGRCSIRLSYGRV